MDYQKIANLLESTSDNISKFRTRNWIEINDESRGNYANGDIKFKAAMLRSNLCDYPDSYILAKVTITITGAGNNVGERQADERDKEVTFKNCAPFTKRISRTNNTDKDNEKLLQQLKSGFKKIISWNKYESSIKAFAQNR